MRFFSSKRDFQNFKYFGQPTKLISQNLNLTVFHKQKIVEYLENFYHLFEHEKARNKNITILRVCQQARPYFNAIVTVMAEHILTLSCP